MWVLLIEKAFAKVVGGYDKLEGGLPAWALETMTGDKVAHYSVDAKGSGKWQKSILVHLEDATNKRKCGLHPVQGEVYSTHDFFDILVAYCAQVRVFFCAVMVVVVMVPKRCSFRGCVHGIMPGAKQPSYWRWRIERNHCSIVVWTFALKLACTFVCACMKSRGRAWRRTARARATRTRPTGVCRATPTRFWT